ncbi:MAG: carotenoid biosynthesis protein [Actinobacteria bacterium]|nr:carotenoid biosynthesis protein [Actinomycetota bacterium]
MLTQVLRATPRPLILASAFFFTTAYFALRFPDAPGAGSYVSTFLIALPSFVALFKYLGTRRAALSLLALSAFGFAIETVGVATGLPYGSFYYGDALGQKFLGLVPYLLPVSYAPLVIGAVAASWKDSLGLDHRLLLILQAAVLLALMDGVLDPGAAVLGFWVWAGGGAYYGVPLSNYAGWLLSGTLAAALLLAAGRWRDAPLPGLLDGAVLALAFWTGVAVFSGLVVPALLGAALLAYLLHRRSRLSSYSKTAPGAGRV